MPVYMDHNATTPLDERVREAMLPFLGPAFGNAASASHAYGWQAQAAVKKAREQVSRLLGCRASDVIWTSGATESNNLALLGAARAFCGKAHIITQATEHKAVLEVCEAAAEWGAETTVLPVDPEGRVRIEDLRAAIRPETVLVSVMAANNEIGTIQPLAEIGALCRERKLIFHSDAAQAAGKLPLDLNDLSIDLVSISGHKMYGPKGVGALIVRPVNREFTLKPLLFGGDQEKGLRPGTLNVPGAVGLGEACEAAESVMTEESGRLMAWRDQIIHAVCGRFSQVVVNGSRRQRLANNISFSFPGLHPDDMALELAGLAFSSGSACNSANPKPSHVLKALGADDALARSTLRLGLGRFTRAEDISFVTDKLLKMLSKVYASG